MQHFSLAGLVCRGLWAVTLFSGASLLAQQTTFDLTTPSSDPAVLAQQVEILHKRVNAGNQQADAVLHAWRRQGIGGDTLYVNMPRLEKLAATRKDPELWAQLGLGYMEGHGGRTPNPDKAREFLEKASAAGNAEASHHLGIMYMHAKGVDQDLDSARQWFALEAQQGNPEGYFELGAIERKFGNNPDEAIRWYTAAGDGGLAKGYARAAQIVRGLNGGTRNDNRSIEVVLLQKAADTGDYRSAYELARVYAEGAGGVDANPHLAGKYFNQVMQSRWRHRAYNYFRRLKSDNRPDGDRKAHADAIQAINTLAATDRECSDIAKQVDYRRAKEQRNKAERIKARAASQIQI